MCHEQTCIAKWNFQTTHAQSCKSATISENFTLPTTKTINAQNELARAKITFKTQRDDRIWPVLSIMWSPAGYSFAFCWASFVSSETTPGGWHMSVSSYHTDYLTHLHDKTACFEAITIDEIAPVTKYRCPLSFNGKATPATDWSWWSNCYLLYS